MTTSVNMKKICLENVPMYINRIRGGNEKVFTAISFKITKFRQLYEGINYNTVISELHWRFRLFKYRNQLIVTLFTNMFQKTIKCFVVYDQRSLSVSPIVEEIAGGIYQAYILLSTVQFQKDCGTVDRDTVHIEFKFDFCKERCLVTRSFIGKMEELFMHYLPTAETRIEKDLEKFTAPDFKIQVKNTEYHVHKHIIAARSKYFCEYLKEHSKKEERLEFKLDTTERAMSYLKTYLYDGKIEKPPADDIVDLYKLADKLIIESLKSLCIALLIDSIDICNVHEIRDMAIKSNIESLVKAANEYLESRGIPLFDNE